MAKLDRIIFVKALAKSRIKCYTEVIYLVIFVTGKIIFLKARELSC